MFKKIISLFLVIAICVSLAVPVRAEDSSPFFGEWLLKGYIDELTDDGQLGLGDFLDVLARPAIGECSSSDSADGCHFFLPMFPAGFVCKYCNQNLTAADLETGYDTYVSDLQTDLGSTVLIDGGVRVYFQPTGYGRFSKVTDETVINLGATSVTGTLITENLYKSTSYGNTSNASFQLWYDTGIEAPFSANYTLGSYGSFSPNTYVKSWSWDELTSGNVVSKGDLVYASGSVYQNNEYHRRIDFTVTSNTIVTGDFSYVCWVDLFPVSGLPSVTNINIDQSTRVGSVAGDFIYGDQIIENMQIVNEMNNTFYNPVTNETINYNNWSYDYSDRSYNLSLETGASVEVRFGDEYLTINEGDTIYNIYYYITNEAPSDPDAPSGEEVTGFFAWWQTEWENFRDWLSEHLPGSGSSGGDVDMNPDIDLPAGDLDPDGQPVDPWALNEYDYSGDPSSEDGFNLLDLIKAVSRGLWKMAKGLVNFTGDVAGNILPAVSNVNKLGNKHNPNGAFGLFNGGASTWN